MHKQKGDCDIIGCPKCGESSSDLDHEFNRITELFSHDECQRKYTEAINLCDELGYQLYNVISAHEDGMTVNWNVVQAALDKYNKFKEVNK